MPTTASLFAIVAALGPIFALILLGYALKRAQFPDDTFWPAAERLIYFVFFPALLVRTLALADLAALAVLDFVGVIAAGFALLSGLLFALRPWLKMSAATFSSVYQGSIRFNTYVGLAAAGALFGTPGLTAAALAIAILVPLGNALSILVLSHSSGATGTRLVRMLLHNPLILACLLGVVLNVSGLGLPLGTGRVLAILADAALPLGLLAVGAGLQLVLTLDQQRALWLTVVCKLLLLPLLTVGLTWGFGVTGVEQAVLILFAALPAAPSAYIMARQLGGDAPLMATILTVETGLAMLTLPVVAWMVR